MAVQQRTDGTNIRNAFLFTKLFREKIQRKVKFCDNKSLHLYYKFSLVVVPVII